MYEYLDSVKAEDDDDRNQETILTTTGAKVAELLPEAELAGGTPRHHRATKFAICFPKVWLAPLRVLELGFGLVYMVLATRVLHKVNCLLSEAVDSFPQKPFEHYILVPLISDKCMQ